MAREETTEVRETSDADDRATSQTVTTRSRVSPGVVAARIIWFITGVIVALLILRVTLLLLAANPNDGFVNFIYQASGIFAAPFFGIFSYTPAYGSSVLEISTVIAIFVYLLIGWGLAKLCTLGSSRNEV